jgi:hypothetical protein
MLRAGDWRLWHTTDPVLASVATQSHGHLLGSGDCFAAITMTRGALAARVIENDGLADCHTFRFLREPTARPCHFDGFGALEVVVVWRPVSCHSPSEWASGLGFFNTEEARGRRSATEKRVSSSGEALQTVSETQHVEDEPQAGGKSIHGLVGLQLHIITAQGGGVKRPRWSDAPDRQSNDTFGQFPMP